jgi:hypothetical protein
MATVQITLKLVQGKLQEGFQLLRSEMETGREQASQEIRSISFQISKLYEFWASPNVEIQRPPPRIHLQKIMVSLKFPPLVQIPRVVPHWGFCHPKPNLIVCQYIQIWGKSIRLENFLKVSQKFLL